MGGMGADPSERELAASLELFDRVAVNLDNLQQVVDEMYEFSDISGIVIETSNARYDQLVREFADLVSGLPPIDGFSIDVIPVSMHNLGQMRIEAMDIPEALVGLQQVIDAAGEAVSEYRHRLQRQRRRLIRERAEELTAQVDALLTALTERYEYDGQSLRDDEDWTALDSAIRELFALLGHAELTGGRVGDLLRHLHFGQTGDAHDIANLDWPDVKPRIVAALYGDREPLPVENVDLATLAGQSSSGRVPTALDFSVLDDEGFERLIFSLFSSTDGYENVSWVMETRAPDRGRDLEVYRVTVDTLAGTIRERVIVQCKAWRRSLSPADCQAALAPLSLWEPPAIDVLIIATTGRFSADAVRWIELHNNEGERPKFHMWADSNLETMLASRSDLVTRFHLRPQS
jgi:Restriction endonuclease